jgi:hypothetical protein
MLTTREIQLLFGKAGDDRNLVTVPMPYPRRIAWDKSAITNRMQCHKLVAPVFQKIHREILAHYGLKKIQELEIDIFGGCYNFRKMRGGSNWSRHSWGIAEDLNPAENGLRTTWKSSQFSMPEYKPMIDIYYANGFVNLGVESNKDAMHFEFLKFLK